METDNRRVASLSVLVFYLKVILLWNFLISLVLAIAPLGLFPFLNTRLGLLGAMPEAVRFIAGFDDVTMVGEPVQQGGSHLGVAKYARPFGKDQVGSDNDAGSLV